MTEYVWTTRTSRKEDIFHPRRCKHVEASETVTRRKRAPLEAHDWTACEVCTGSEPACQPTTSDFSYQQAARNGATAAGEDYTDPAYLETAYCDRGLTTREMADECGCSAATIRRHMDTNGIERRAPADGGHALPADAGGGRGD